MRSCRLQSSRSAALIAGWALEMLAVPSVTFANPLGTTVSFQGQLMQSGAPFTGTADLECRVFDALAGGIQIGPTLTASNVAVADGLFTVSLDFGLGVFNGDQRFLEIAVRSPAGAGNFTALSPRQAITATPYAIYALSGPGSGGPWAVDGNNVFNTNTGNVGIGTTSPARKLHVFGEAPALRLQENDDPASYSLLEDWQPGIMRLMKVTGLPGGSLIDFDPMPLDGIGHAVVRVFRATNTTGAKAMHFYRGNNTNETHAAIGVDGSNSYFQLGGGNFGIGTSSPAAKLDVNGAVNSTGGYSTNHSYRYVGSLGEYWRMGARGVAFACGTANIEPFLEMKSPYTGDVQAEIYRDCLSARGVIVADEKNFRAPNPADLTTDIWYCSIEGPEAAMYVRGTARLTDGRATVELPDHFRNLASEAGMTVQVTPLSIESKGLAVLRKKLDGIEVGELGGGMGNYEFDWRVEAVRKGYEDYQVIRPWKPSDADETKAWENRMRWIEERKAHDRP